LVSGPNNADFSSAKSAQLHLNRLNAAKLGSDGIRGLLIQMRWSATVISGLGG